MAGIVEFNTDFNEINIKWFNDDMSDNPIPAITSQVGKFHL